MRLPSLLATVGLVGTATAQTWNAAADFDKDHNPAGAWSCGYRVEDTGSFAPFATKGTFNNIDFWYLSGTGLPSVGHNATASTQVFLPSGKLMLHPGNTASLAGDQSFVVWTAPAAGDYRVSALFAGIDTRDPHVALRLTLNGANVWGAVLEGTGSTQAYDPSFWTFAAGDKVGFGVANLGSFVGDRNWTQLDATIQAVPEPASLGALGLGAAALLRRRRAA